MAGVEALAALAAPLAAKFEKYSAPDPAGMRLMSEGHQLATPLVYSSLPRGPGTSPTFADAI